MREEIQRQRDEAQRQREQLLEQQAIMQRQMMEAQLTALREQLVQVTAAPRGESDELRQIREAQERMRQENERLRQESERKLEVERQQRERERERYEQQRRDEIMQRELREAREATERRIEALVAQNRAGDPVLDAMKEQSRQAAEQMREIARMQQASTDRMAQFMVAPSQLAQIMKDNASGSDVVMRNLVDTVSGIGTMYKAAAEQMLQMSGGGSEPASVRLIQEGLGRASEVAERFLAVKRDAVISEAKVKQAQAAAEAQKITAEAQLRAAAIQAQRWSPPPQAIQGGLNGAAELPAPAARPAVANGAANGHAPVAAAPVAAAPVAAAPTAGEAPAGRTGPSEEELFGVAYESVMRLRKGVADGKLNPEQTIDAILKGVQHVVANNIEVHAFTLFTSERWADFIDVMLPTAPQEFRNECVRILIEEVDVGGEEEAEQAS
jgi:hypothetical protein